MRRDHCEKSKKKPKFKNLRSPLAGENEKAMNIAVLCQVFGVLAMQSIEQNGLLILYFRRLGLSASLILSLLSVVSLLQAVLRIPASHRADRVGRKRMGQAGSVLGTTAVALIVLTGFGGTEVVRAFAVVSILFFAVGEGLFSSGWHSILHPIVPVGKRGRFFGVLRFSWQITGIVFAAGASLLLERFPTVRMYQIIFAVIALGALTRFFLYRTLPDLQVKEYRRYPFIGALKKILRQPGFLRFIVYVSIRFLLAGAVLQVLALLEREVLGFSEGRVVMLANFGLIGNLAGFVIGAFFVDRGNKRPFFLITHIGIGLLSVAFLLRFFITAQLVVFYYGGLHFFLGFMIASFSIAMTAKEYSLITTDRKALALSFTGFAFIGSRALSRLIASLLLHPAVLPRKSAVAGIMLSNYDVVLLIFGAGLLLTTPLTGIVPGLRKESGQPNG